MTLSSMLSKPLACLSAVALGTAAAAPSAPGAGLWDLSMKMEGVPSGGETRSAKACLSAEALSNAPEQTLFEAASRGGRGPSKCELREFAREGARSAWRSQCEGPMGKMQGAGAGTLGPDAADLQQSFSVKAPFGTLELKQMLSARRVGSC